MEPSAMAKRIASRYLRALEVSSAESAADTSADSAADSAADRTAIPKSGPGKAVLQKNISNLSKALDGEDHEGFNSALEDLQSNWKRVDQSFHAQREKPLNPMR